MQPTHAKEIQPAISEYAHVSPPPKNLVDAFKFQTSRRTVYFPADLKRRVERAEEAKRAAKAREIEKAKRTAKARGGHKGEEGRKGEAEDHEVGKGGGGRPVNHGRQYHGTTACAVDNDRDAENGREA